MPAGRYNFRCEQGAHFERVVTVKDENDDPVNLTGYSAQMQVRKDVDSSELLVELSTTNGRIAVDATTGTLTLTLTSTQTAAITRSGVYDLVITHVASGEVTRVIEGQFFLTKAVTR